MNKFLLGTTALVACGSVAGAALAAEPIKVQINGYYAGALVLNDDDSDDAGDDTIKQDVALNINGSTVLDNGITAGFVFEIEDGSHEGAMSSAGGSESATNESVFAYLEGSGGRGEIGSRDGVGFLMAYVAPAPTAAVAGVDSPTFLNISRLTTGTRTSARITMSGEANKINYFTPRMSGFQLGASYTPSNDCVGVAQVYGPAGPGWPTYADSCNGNSLPNTFGVRSDQDGGVENIVEIAGNYVGKLGEVDVAASVAWATGNHEGVSGSPTFIDDDPMAFSLGLNLSASGFTVGGAWYQSEDLVCGVGCYFGPPSGGSDEEVWNIGATYATGPWQVGVAYQNSEIEPNVSIDENQLTLLDVGAQYKLGPGVTVGVDFTVAEDEVSEEAASFLGYDETSIEDKSVSVTLLLEF